MKLIIFSIAVCIFYFTSSCKKLDNTIYSEFKTFGENGMTSDFAYSFNPFPVDSLVQKDSFNIILTVRYSKNFQYNYLPLIIESENPDKDESFFSENLSIDLFSSTGEPIGRGKAGIFSVSDTIIKNMPYNYNYKLFIRTNLKDSKGIEAIGIKTEK